MTAPNLPIGNTCVWYPRADRESGPRAALVTGPHPANLAGLLNLTVFSDGATEGRAMRGVRHIDDPYLEGRPEMTENRGAWDYATSEQARPHTESPPKKPLLSKKTLAAVNG